MKPRAILEQTTLSDGSPIGQFRWLAWSLQPVTPTGENTAVQELQVELAP